MTNLVSVHFSTSSQDDPVRMLTQFNLKLTFMMPFPVWRLPLSGVVVTQWFGSLVHGVHLDKLPLMCLCFSILNCEGEMTLLTAHFPEVPWWTANTVIVEHFMWHTQKKEFLWESYMTFSLVLHNGSESLVIALWKHSFRECLDNPKQPVFYSISSEDYFYYFCCNKLLLSLLPVEKIMEKSVDRVGSSKV